MLSVGWDSTWPPTIVRRPIAQTVAADDTSEAHTDHKRISRNPRTTRPGVAGTWSDTPMLCGQSTFSLSARPKLQIGNHADVASETRA